MVSRLHIDIETRSRVDLKKTGVYRYVRCPDFRILMASWSLDGSPIRTALTSDEIQEIPGLWEPEVTKVAHNAQFERVCFSQFARGLLAWQPHEPLWYLPIEQYHDTQAVAGELGYPQSLAKLAPALGATLKDEAGTRLINLFSKPNRRGAWNGPDTHPMEWLDFIAYCEQDTATLAEVDALLGDFPTETERRVFFVDQKINDRGMAIDAPLAELAVVVGAENETEQVARVTELTGLENPNSVAQLTPWTGLPDLQAKTVERALDGELTDVQREVLQLRQELALAAPKKFATALASHVDGRLHGGFKFFGAHTGRWAGRGTQPHNLPREQFERFNPKTEKWEFDEWQMKAAILDLHAGFGASALTLKRLVRPLFLGPLTVVDYAAIEARVLAWLAGEQWVLDAARAGRDLYVETAERMGGLSRAQGKIAVLALGYNGGPGSLRHMAGDGDYYDPQGRAVRGGTLAEAAGDDTRGARLIKTMSDDELYGLFVYPWRDANANTVHFWKLLEGAFRSGGPAGDHIVVEKDGNDRLLRLPSGRAICYRKCGNRYDAEGRPRLSFLSPQGYRAETYGGRLAENVTQAVARDILAEALVRLDDRGYAVVGHVHDEILIEGEHDVDTVAEIMCELPSWATGLPVDGEGFVTERYRKG